MPGFVFISYSRRDRSYVDALTSRLDQEHIAYWVDHAIDYGDRWASTIQRKIEQAAAIVVVVTPSALTSDWVDRELSLAQDLRKPMLPLLRKGTGTSIRLSNVQFENVTDGRLPSAAYFDTLRRRVAQAPAAGSAGPGASFTASRPPPVRQPHQVGPINPARNERWGVRALFLAAFALAGASISGGQERDMWLFLPIFGVPFIVFALVRRRRFAKPGRWWADVTTTVLLAAVTFYLTGSSADGMQGSSDPFVVGLLPVAVILSWFAVLVWSAQCVRDRPGRR